MTPTSLGPKAQPSGITTKTRRQLRSLHQLRALPTRQNPYTLNPVRMILLGNGAPQHLTLEVGEHEGLTGLASDLKLGNRILGQRKGG